MKKKSLAIVMLLVLIGTMMLPNTVILAADPALSQHEDPIDEPLDYTAMFLCTYLFELRTGGKMYCSASTVPKNPTYVSTIKLELQKRATTGSWSTVKTWTQTNASSVIVSGEYYVAHGTYQMKITTTVKDANGKLLETDIAYSHTLVY